MPNIVTSQSAVSAKTQYLIKKWGKRIKATESVLGPMNMERKSALAISLENTNHRIRTVENTQPGSIGQYKRYALDIVNAVVPNLITYDIASVQAIDNRVGMINYISYNYGRDKGNAKKDQMFASSLNMGQSDMNYTSSSVDSEVVGAPTGTKIETNLQWTPVIPGTVYFSIVGSDGTTITGKDDGNGTITGTGISSATINYTTGAIEVNLSSTTSDEGVVTYDYNNEDAPIANVPDINLEIKSLPVIAKSRKMKAVYAFDAAYELEKEFGQDIDSLLATEAAGELAHEIDMEIAGDICKMANAGTPITWSKSLPVGVNLLDHYDSFYSKLIEGSNQIFHATRKIQPNFMVCGLGVASVIQVMRNFTPSGTQAIGPHFLGTLGNFKVYVSPDYSANEFVLGYKGSSFMDSGMFYCPYMPILSTDLLMTDDFAGRKGWATMYAKKMVNNKMYLRGYITD